MAYRRGWIENGITGLCVLIWLAACQPAEQKPGTAKQTPIFSEDAFVTADGTRLPLKSWLPEKAKPKAVIVALHGFNDYSYAFELPGRYLSDHQVALYAYDQRGFGAAPQRGIWPGNTQLASDLRDAISVLAARHPDTPVYALGESMGGAVVIAACADNGCAPASGVMLAAPAVWGDESFSSFYRISLWLLAHTIPASEWTGEGLDILATNNIELLREMSKDPLIIKETRVDAMYGIVGLMDTAYQSVKQVNLPVLFLYGAKDEIIPAPPIAQVIDELTAPHSVGYYPDGYHMLLRDLGRETVLKDMLSWLDDRYRPLPSGHDMGWKEELLPLKD